MIHLNLEGYRPRKGDVILLRGVVRYDLHGGNSVSVDVTGAYTTAHIKLGDIVGVEKLVFERGDWVEAQGRTGTILALSGEFAWIDTGAKEHPPFTAPIARMVRVSEPKETREDPPPAVRVAVGALPDGDDEEDI